MRLLNLYVVLDTKAKTLIGPIVHDPNAVPIIRQIAEAVNGDKGIIAKNPEDFAILHIGMIDEETGHLHSTKGEALIWVNTDSKTYENNEPEVVTTALALKAIQA